MLAKILLFLFNKTTTYRQQAAFSLLEGGFACCKKTLKRQQVLTEFELRTSLTSTTALQTVVGAKISSSKHFVMLIRRRVAHATAYANTRSQ